MAVKISSNPRVTVTWDNEPVTFIMRPWTEIDKLIKTLLTGRFKMIGRIVRNESTEARIKFFDSAVFDVEGVETDSGILNRASDPEFFKLIPANVKCSVAMTFEEVQTGEEEIEPESDLE